MVSSLQMTTGNIQYRFPGAFALSAASYGP